MDLHKLNKLADAAIAVGVVVAVLCAWATLLELARVEAALERSERAIARAEAARSERWPVVVPTVSTEPEGEDPSEDAMIELALLEQGYYREDVPLSYELQDALHTACDEFGVRYELALAVIERETGFRNVAGDGGESAGHFQIQRKWWSGLMEQIGADDLADPADNFRTGCAILAELTARYGNERDALTAYNSGHPGESEYADAVLEMAEQWAGNAPAP